MHLPECQVPQHTPQHASQDVSRERQVLIDKDPQVGSNQLNALNEWELVAKANEVLNKMVGQASHGPSDLKALGAMRLQNGSIVYELDSPKMANWLHKERSSFMASFGKMSVVKDNGKQENQA